MAGGSVCGMVRSEESGEGDVGGYGRGYGVW